MNEMMTKDGTTIHDKDRDTRKPIAVCHGRLPTRECEVVKS